MYTFNIYIYLLPLNEYTFLSRSVKASAYLTRETRLLSGLFTTASSKQTNCHGKEMEFEGPSLYLRFLTTTTICIYIHIYMHMHAINVNICILLLYIYLLFFHVLYISYMYTYFYLCPNYNQMFFIISLCPSYIYWLFFFLAPHSLVSLSLYKPSLIFLLVSDYPY